MGANVAEVDNATWDANRAMGQCSTAAEYGKICAGKKAGDPGLRASWALPHHYLGRAPVPNANGVRNALSRLPQTQGLTNAGQARSHLEAHMSAINPDRAAASMALRDDGKLLARAPVEEWEIRHSGRKDETFTVRGYAAVFDQLSHDMGGFRTLLAQGSMDKVLATNPDVHFVWDHDTRYVGARTSNGTLSLSADESGLFMDAQVGAYSWAKDLRLALERGDIDQGSMAIEIADDSWDVNDLDEVIRTVNDVSGLFDVTVTAQGAFPQTSLAVAYSLVRAAVADGRLPEEIGATVEPEGRLPEEAEATLVAADEQGEPPSQPGGEEEAVNPRIEELKHLRAVYRDEIAEIRERIGRLK
jgi:Escherichia/Staphylococcus phage prohead protease